MDLVTGRLLDAQPLGHRLVDRLPGVERAHRILEDDLSLPAKRAEVAPLVPKRLALESDLALRQTIGEKHMRGRQRSVATEIVLDNRREPAQFPIRAATRGGPTRKRSFRQVHLHGYFAHPGLRRPVRSLEQTDSSRVALERTVSEGVDHPDADRQAPVPAEFWRSQYKTSAACVSAGNTG